MPRCLSKHQACGLARTNLALLLRAQIARERYGRSYDELDTNEKRAVAGVIGGLKRREELGSEVNTQ